MKCHHSYCNSPLRGIWISVENNLSNISALKSTVLSSWQWQDSKITKGCRIHPLGTMNICRICHAEMFLSGQKWYKWLLTGSLLPIQYVCNNGKMLQILEIKADLFIAVRIPVNDEVTRRTLLLKNTKSVDFKYLQTTQFDALSAIQNVKQAQTHLNKCIHHQKHYKELALYWMRSNIRHGLSVTSDPITHWSSCSTNPHLPSPLLRNRSRRSILPSIIEDKALTSTLTPQPQHWLIPLCCVNLRSNVWHCILKFAFIWSGASVIRVKGWKVYWKANWNMLVVCSDS